MTRALPLPSFCVIAFAALLFCPAASLAANKPTTVQIDTHNTLPLPSRRHFSGINSQLFLTADTYRDPKLVALTQKLDLGWIRFPGGTIDDVLDWKSGDLPDKWIAQFKGTKTDAYPTFLRDVKVNRGKGLSSIDDYADFLSKMTTSPLDTPGASHTHTIGVINTFTDTPKSAAELVLAAKKKHLHVDVWELGNEPYYFDSFYPTATAYLDKVLPYAKAVRAADPDARVAVYLQRKEPWMHDMAAYPHRYWDEIYFHVYPGPKGSLGEEIAAYNGFLPAMSNHFIDNDLVGLFGKDVQVEVSEFNINDVRGTLYSAVFVAEYTLRLSSDPHVTQVGMHILVGVPTSRSAAILPTNNFNQQAIAAADAGKTIDTANLDYGYYLTPYALALEVINGVINTSAGLWPTSVTAGPTVTANFEGTPSNATYAVYAQAYKMIGHTAHLLVTNKSGEPQPLNIVVDGQPLKTTFTLTSIGGSDPEAKNTPDAPNAVAIQTSTTQDVTVPPYAVMDVSWATAATPE